MTAEKAYREQALKLYPWVCGRCAREFSGVRLRELTVHHKNGDHDYNPPDGSNWELLCIYCHENEHARYEDARQAGVADAQAGGGGKEQGKGMATHKGLAGLADLVKQKRKP